MAAKSPVVVLDPGHGGTAAAGGSSPNNTSGGGKLEKDLTLDIARRVRGLLDGDAAVFLTRDSDTNLSLTERAGFARAVNADVFLSLHFNGHPDPGHDSTEVYVARHGSARTRRLAGALQSALAITTGAEAGGVVEADLGVLDAGRHLPGTAACLAEILDLTNEAQAARLDDVGYRDRIAAAVAAVVRAELAAGEPMAGAMSVRTPEVERVADALRSEGIPDADVEAFLDRLAAPAAAQALHAYPVRQLDGGRVAREIPPAQMLPPSEQRLLLAALATTPVGPLAEPAQAAANQFDVTVGIGPAGAPGFELGLGAGYGVIFAPGDRVGYYGSVSSGAGSWDSASALQVTVVHGGPEGFGGSGYSLAASVSTGAGAEVAAHALFDDRGFIGVTAPLDPSAGIPFEALARYRHTTAAMALAVPSGGRSPEVERVIADLRAQGVPAADIEAFLVRIEGPPPAAPPTFAARQLDGGRVAVEIPSVSLLDNWEKLLLIAAIGQAPATALFAGMDAVCNAYDVTVGIGAALSGGLVAGAGLGAGLVFAPGGKFGYYGSISGIVGAILSISAAAQVTVVRGGPANFGGSALAVGVTIDTGVGPGFGAHVLLSPDGQQLGVTGEVAVSLGLSPIEAFAQYQYTATTLGVPARAAGAVDYRVPGTVPQLRQPNGMACWATVTTMLTSWRDGESRSIESVLGDIGPQYLTMFQSGQGLPGSLKEQFLTDAGLTWELPQSFLVEGWEELLRAHGPLWVTTDEDTSPGWAIHARVMVAISGDGSPAGTTVEFVDPADGQVHTETLEAFERKFLEEARDPSRPLRIQVVHWPAGTTIAYSARAAGAVDYAVPGIVPELRQPNGMACWATVTTMLRSWRDGASYPIETVLGDIGAQYLTMFQNGQGLPGSLKEQFLRDAGLEWEAPQSFGVDGWASLLRDHGPLWVTTDEDPSDDWAIHARVLIRISGDGTADGTRLWFVDPATGGTRQETVAQFIPKYQEEVRRTGNTRIQVVHWPAGTTVAYSAPAGALSVDTQVASVLADIRARAARAAGASRSVAGTNFLAVLRSRYLTAYLAGPGSATGRAAIELIGRQNTSGHVTTVCGHPDFWEQATPSFNTSPIPSGIRSIPGMGSLPANFGAATEILTVAHRRTLSHLDVPFLLGRRTLDPLDCSTVMARLRDPDLQANNGVNESQLMHWATGVRFQAVSHSLLRDLFLAYEMWHLELWDVFGHDPINDLIVEDAGRHLAERLAAGTVTSANLVATVDEGFAAARAWVGALLRVRQAQLDAQITAATPPSAFIHWSTEITPTSADHPYRSPSIRAMLTAGRSEADVKASDLVARYVEVYTLIAEAEQWERTRGPIDVGFLQRRMLDGSLDGVFRRLAGSETGRASLVRSAAALGVQARPAVSLASVPAAPGSAAMTEVFGQTPWGYLFVPVADMVRGIDVSHWQGAVDWARVVRAGFGFAYVKATEGRTHQDARFAANWAGMRAAGIPRGAYHLLREPSSSAVADQAQNFIDHVAHLPGDLPPAIDVEFNRLEQIIAELGRQHAAAYIFEWCERVEAATRYQPILYMSQRGIDALHGHVGPLPALELWMPRYRNINNLPPLPLNAAGELIFPHWSIWQHSETGTVDGINPNNRVDLNVFNGNAANFATWMANVQP